MFQIIVTVLQLLVGMSKELFFLLQLVVLLPQLLHLQLVYFQLRILAAEGRLQLVNQLGVHTLAVVQHVFLLSEALYLALQTVNQLHFPLQFL